MKFPFDLFKKKKDYNEMPLKIYGNLVFEHFSRGLADKPEDLPMRVIIPAYIVSELKTAFQIGFLIFLPFLIIDLVVASILMAMGMMMLSPMIVSLPFKLMLFVIVDGWSLIMGTLVQSFGLGVPG